MIDSEQAYLGLHQFLDENRLLNLGIDYDVVEQWDELNASEEILNKLEKAKALYLPAQDGKIILFAMNLNSIEDIRKTIQHEIFGHVAINYLWHNQKIELLNSIEKEFKNPNSELRETIDIVQKAYPDVSSKHQAEEVFAYVAENTSIDLEKKFKPFSLVRGNTKEKIENIVQNLAAGIREDCIKQRIYPKTNNDLGVDFSQTLQK